MPNTVPEDDMQRIRAALLAGRKIEAIKLYRESSGRGLKQAKDFVDAMEEELRKTSPEPFSATPKSGGCGAAVVCLLGLLVLLVCALLGAVTG